MKPYILLLTFCFLVPDIGVAQSKKIPVAVFQDGDDSVGQAVAFSLKEAIRASQSFKFVDDEVTPKTARIVVHLTSMDNGGVSETKGISSAIAAVIVYDSSAMPVLGVFLTAAIKVCGKAAVEACAKQLLPAIDKQADRLRLSWPNLWKTL